MTNKTGIKVSNCCGKHGFIEVFDGRLSGTNYISSEDIGVCPVCKEHCVYVEQVENKEEDYEPEDWTDKINMER